MAILLADFSPGAEENACQDSGPGCLIDLKWYSFTEGDMSINKEVEISFHGETALHSDKTLKL